MNAHTSLNGTTGTSSTTSSISHPLTNDDAYQFLAVSIGDPMENINNVSSFTDGGDFYQQLQQHSTTFEQFLSQQQQHHHQQQQIQQQTIRLSAGQGFPGASTDMKTDHKINNKQHAQTELYHSQYHQLQQYISSGGDVSTLNSPMTVNITSSVQETNKDYAASANQSNPSNQQTLHHSPSNQSINITPDSSIYPMPFDSNSGDHQTNGKRLNQDHLETNSTSSGSPFTKKAKPNTTIHQKSDHDTKTTITAETSATPTTRPRFTAASFQTLTREQLVDRLVTLENERIDLLWQLENNGDNRNSNLVSPTAENNNLASSNMIDRNNKHITGDDDDDDDDEEEGAASESHTADANTDDFDSSNMEMKCLWKGCGVSCIGGPNLTDHIITTHIGGGKSLYRCEWENCPRNQKPFTKRHKLCNHLRRHSGERPFVCDKPGCGKRFSRPDYLITHIKTHSNVRPFICHIPECKKEYYHARSLKKHLKSHTDQKANENNDSALDNSNSTINLPASYAPSITTASTGIQQQQQQHIYPFQEPLALSQFILPPTSNTTISSMHSKQPLDPSLYDPTHSLFDPLAFQDLSTLQSPPLPQQQFAQTISTSNMSMSNTNTNADTMNQSTASIQLQQQSQ